MKKTKNLNIKNILSLPNDFQETIIFTEMKLKKDINNISNIKKLLYLYSVKYSLKKRLVLNIMIQRIILNYQNILLKKQQI